MYGFEWTDLKLAMEAKRLLGHIGIITDLCTSSSQKFIVSADFEGKIRVSNLPNTYSIESFCLGHEKYAHFSSTKHHLTVFANQAGDQAIAALQ